MKGNFGTADNRGRTQILDGLWDGVFFELKAVETLVVICGIRVPEIQGGIRDDAPMYEVRGCFNLMRQGNACRQRIAKGWIADKRGWRNCA